MPKCRSTLMARIMRPAPSYNHVCQVENGVSGVLRLESDSELSAKFHRFESGVEVLAEGSGQIVSAGERIICAGVGVVIAGCFRAGFVNVAGTGDIEGQPSGDWQTIGDHWPIAGGELCFDD